MANWVIRILILLLIVLIGVYLYLNLEKKEVVVNIGPASEVYLKQFLAAKKYLEPRGIELIERSKPPAVADFSTGDVVVVTDQKSIVSEQMARDLYQWVESGGHLVWSTDGDYEDTDSTLSILTGVTWRYASEGSREYASPIVGTVEYWQDALDAEDDRPFSEQLEEYNQQLEELEEKRDTEESEQPAEEFDESEELRPSEAVLQSISDYEQSTIIEELVRLEKDSLSAAIWFHQHGWRVLDHPLIDPEYTPVEVDNQRLLTVARSALGAALIQIEVGYGTMTVLVTTDIWNNDEIGYFDHAALLSEIVGDTERVIFQVNPEWPSIWQLLREWALEFMLVLTLVTLLMLVKLSHRFGPILGGETTTRRSLMEHIKASANFHWRNKHTDHLLSPMRSAVVSRMRLSYANFDQLSEKQQLQLIAEKSAVPLSDVENAFLKQDDLPEKTSLTDWQFAQSVQLLNKIRKEL